MDLGDRFGSAECLRKGDRASAPVDAEAVDRRGSTDRCDPADFLGSSAEADLIDRVDGADRGEYWAWSTSYSMQACPIAKSGSMV